MLQSFYSDYFTNKLTQWQYYCATSSPILFSSILRMFCLATIYKASSPCILQVFLYLKLESHLISIFLPSPPLLILSVQLITPSGRNDSFFTFNSPGCPLLFLQNTTLEKSLHSFQAVPILSIFSFPVICFSTLLCVNILFFLFSPHAIATTFPGLSDMSLVCCQPKSPLPLNSQTERFCHS